MTRILIVEDSPTQAERLRIILEAKDFETEVAVDADAALGSLAATRFDMVISDIVMPGMSGYDLCRKIKSDPAWKTIPVILLTTRKDPMDIFRGLECGADNFYTKPYDAERLVERITHIFYNRQLRCEGKLKVGIEVAFFGKTFLVDREREQILDLLISTFEDTVNTNLELEESKRELTSAKAKIEEYARLLEDRVRTSEDLYSAIVEGVTNGIITIDERRIVSSFNPTAEKIFGYGAAEVIGRNVNMLMPEVSRNAHDGYVASYLRTGVGTSRKVADTGRCSRDNYRSCGNTPDTAIEFRIERTVYHGVHSIHLRGLRQGRRKHHGGKLRAAVFNLGRTEAK
jgi:DNA-binding response OmpR family regulator